MIRKIRLWPDPILTQPCAPVSEIDETIRKLADDMLKTMYFAEGRGLAAPQVGEAVRLFVMDATWKDGARAPRVFVNPVIEESSDDLSENVEACLSIPGISASVTRPAAIRLSWTDLDGASRSEKLTGFDALCAQHEIDHLDGIVTFDRVSPEDRFQLERMYAQ